FRFFTTTTTTTTTTTDNGPQFAVATTTRRTATAVVITVALIIIIVTRRRRRSVLTKHTAVLCGRVIDVRFSLYIVISPARFSPLLILFDHLAQVFLFPSQELY